MTISVISATWSSNKAAYLYSTRKFILKLDGTWDEGFFVADKVVAVKNKENFSRLSREKRMRLIGELEHRISEELCSAYTDDADDTDYTHVD